MGGHLQSEGCVTVCRLFLEESQPALHTSLQRWMYPLQRVPICALSLALSAVVGTTQYVCADRIVRDFISCPNGTNVTCPCLLFAPLVNVA